MRPHVILPVVAGAAVAVCLTACGGSDRGTAAASTHAPTYTHAEQHWAQGWCDYQDYWRPRMKPGDWNGWPGFIGVPLASPTTAWPAGFTDCVQTQLPKAQAGIALGKRGRSKDTWPQFAYCHDSQSKQIRAEYQRSTSALHECMHREFGMSENTIANSGG